VIKFLNLSRRLEADILIHYLLQSFVSSISYVKIDLADLKARLKVLNNSEFSLTFQFCCFKFLLVQRMLLISGIVCLKNKQQIFLF
jgi:hypothetical protein